jgi:plasmid stabilization system protein ParE
MLPLRDFPEMGAPLLVSGKQSVPYRYLVCGQYLIFYHLEEERVLVDRVLYGRRNYMALLFGNHLEDEQ